MRIKVDSRLFDKIIDNLEELPLDVMKQAHPFLRNETPIRSGNARNKTKRQGLKIKSNYPYAGRLDEGWSNQAPKGFTDPTIDQLDKLISRAIKRV